MNTQSKFTLDQLRTLVAVVERGSYRKAADFLYITQPAVTLRINDLCKATGVIVFDRSGTKKSKAELTSQGRVLYGLSKGILSKCDELTVTLERAADALSCIEASCSK